MTISEAIQLAIDDHLAYAKGVVDREFIDALQQALAHFELKDSDQSEAN